MANRDKFGKFVLFEELDSSGLGAEYRAAKLGPGGLEKIVSVLRLSPTVSANVEVARALMDQAKVAAQLQNPNIARIYGIGKVESSYYISTEFVEGKNLRQVFERCRRDAFPFSIDHGLLIASKVCSALEYSHGRKTEQGGRYFHGLVNPREVLVSYEGEVRVRGFGHWMARVREAGALGEEDLRYLAPEQIAGTGDTRSDVYAVGTILWETLTGKAYAEPTAQGDLAARLAAAKLQAPTGEDDRIPKPIAEILSRSLVPDPAGRYAEIQEMRKAIDTLLFSGDFTPTTFNLAFFMHSVFRDDIDRESKQLKEEREASYAEFLSDAAAKGTPLPTSITTTPVPAAPPRAEPHHTPAPVAHETHPTPAPAPSPPESHPASHAPVSSKQAAAGFTFHKDAERKRRGPLLAGIGVLIAALAGAGYWYFAMGPGAHHPPAAPTTTTLSPQAVAALERVKELEEKLKAFEEEKAAAEQKAQEEAEAKLQKEAQARGSQVDAAALQRARDEAAKAARAEQERKQQEERKRLEQEKAAEEARLAEERRKAEEAARLAAATSTTTTLATTTTTTTTTTTLPPLHPGSLVSLTDPGVIPPQPTQSQPLAYPPLALRYRIEGTVDLSVLVDENGNVADVKLIKKAGGKWGLNEAAMEHVSRQRYKPAVKDGVPVKVWITVRVPFKLP